MIVHGALSVVTVADLGAARSFYTTLLGREPDLEPMPSLAQWDLDSGSLQVTTAPELSGRAMTTLLVTDFDAAVAHLDAVGIEHREVVEGTVSRLTQLRDPAGNLVTVAEVPSGP